MEEVTLQDAIQSMANEADKKGCETLFLSSEAFAETEKYMHSTSKIVCGLDRYFGAHNVQLVMCVRNHFDYVESAYAQFLKGGIFQVPHKRVFKSGPSTLSGFLEGARQKNGFDFYDLSHVIELLKSYTGKEKIEVYSIEKSDTHGKDIVETLAERFNLKVGANPPSSNQRFSPKCLLALNFAISKVGFQATKLLRKSILKEFKNHPFGFSPILNVSEEQFDLIKLKSEFDREYFEKNVSGCFSSVFSVPDRTRINERFRHSIELTDFDKMQIEKIISQSAML
jgi:hypothetical protein